MRIENAKVMNVRILLRNNIAHLSCGVGLAFVIAAGTLLQPTLVGMFINSLARDGSAWLLIILLCVLVVTSLAAALQHYIVSVAADRSVYQMRKELISKIVGLPLEEVDKRRSGEFVTRLTADASIVSTAISTSLVEFVGGLIVVVGAIVYMAVLDLWLFTIVVSVILSAAVIVAMVSTKIEQLSRKVQDDLANLGSTLQNSLASIRAVKTLGVESLLKQRMWSEAYGAYQARKKMSWIESILSPISELSVYLSLVVVLAFGSFRVAAGNLDADHLAVFLTLLFVTAIPLTQLIGSVTAFREARGALQRIDELMGLPLEAPFDIVPCLDDHTWDIEGSIEMEDVRFGYGEHRVLDHFSMSIADGEKVAIMGQSGAGKTTLLSIILGLYCVEQGSIRIGDQFIENWDIRRLRCFVSYVEQEPVLFPGTLEDNLIMGTCLEISRQELLEALTKVGLQSHANSESLATPIFDRNVGLSGGEKQKVAIARALLRGSKVILVDEPTSAMDVESRNQAVEALFGIDATVLLVTHDEGLAATADRIVYI